MSDPLRSALDELRRVGLRGDARRLERLVPDVVLRSWRRSIGSSVETDALCQRYQDIDSESLLCQAADPVLDRWQDRLTNTGTTLFLSDRGGSIVARRTSDTSVRRRLDQVHAAEGFDYSEGSVGTNGLGTSMVEGHAVMIEGSQHYNDALADLACAAAPVRAPAGGVLGSISLGGPVESANPLMLSLTREIGQQIEERLRGESRPQDLALAMSFMRFTNSRRPTVVVDGESLLANTPGLPYVSVHSHVALWEMLNAHDWRTERSARLWLDDRGVEVMARRVQEGPRAHYVVHFGDDDDPTQPLGAVEATRSRRTTGRVVAPPVLAPSVIIVDGPPGSGRATAARAMWVQDGAETSRTEVLLRPGVTSWNDIDTALHGGTDVLLRRGELLVDDEVAGLIAVVRRHREAVGQGQRRSRLGLTVCSEAASAAARHFVQTNGATTRTTALAEAPERIPGMVRSILDEKDPTGQHTISPAALQALVQWSWPGNLVELTETVTALVADNRPSVIERRDLPDYLRHAPPRRHLSLLEAAERGAIIRALGAANGNKSEAAALLGIGRTTLYRRLRQLGLDGDESTL